MGCASSRLDVDGGFPMPFKARPAFLHRLDDIKTRRNSQTPTLTLSKKELLLHEEDHDINNIVKVSSSLPPTKNSSFSSTIDQHQINENIQSCVTSEGICGSQNIINNIKHSSSSSSQIKQYCINGTNEKLGIVGTPERKSFQQVTTRLEGPTPPCGTTNSESDEDQLDERMVRKKDDMGFPGSPSFRVYFNDTTNLHDMNVTDKLGPGEDNASVSQKVEYPLRQEKKQKRRRSFKKVLPRGGQAAMKNLLNVRSCMSSPHSTHDQTHLLTPKTHAA